MQFKSFECKCMQFFSVHLSCATVVFLLRIRRRTSMLLEEGILETILKFMLSNIELKSLLNKITIRKWTSISCHK